MLLTLIAQVARADGRAGPIVVSGGRHVLLRDWLCDALTPMGRRGPRRLALTARIREEMARKDGASPDDAAIEEEVLRRVRAAGKCNLSRAVSELVQAGLLRRHYQGHRVDHHNRGAQRQAVYTLMGEARLLVTGERRAAAIAPPRQGELALH